MIDRGFLPLHIEGDMRDIGLDIVMVEAHEFEMNNDHHCTAHISQQVDFCHYLNFFI